MHDEELPIIRSFYDLTLWLLLAIAKLPRERRLTLRESGYRPDALLG